MNKTLKALGLAEELCEMIDEDKNQKFLKGSVVGLASQVQHAVNQAITFAPRRLTLEDLQIWEDEEDMQIFGKRRLVEWLNKRIFGEDDDTY